MAVNSTFSINWLWTLLIGRFVNLIYICDILWFWWRRTVPMRNFKSSGGGTGRPGRSQYICNCLVFIKSTQCLNVLYDVYIQSLNILWKWVFPKQQYSYSNFLLITCCLVSDHSWLELICNEWYLVCKWSIYSYINQHIIFFRW